MSFKSLILVETTFSRRKKEALMSRAMSFSKPMMRKNSQKSEESRPSSPDLSEARQEGCLRGVPSGEQEEVEGRTAQQLPH